MDHAQSYMVVAAKLQKTGSTPIVDTDEVGSVCMIFYSLFSEVEVSLKENFAIKLLYRVGEKFIPTQILHVSSAL